MSFDASYEDGTLYMVTDVNNVEHHMMSKADVVDFAGKELSETLNSILNANDGEEVPTRCNHCEYCRLTKKIELPIHASDIEIY